jgi:hypothetical protein
MKGYL